MIGFREFQKNYTKKFVCFSLSDKSQADLRRWCQEKGFDIKKSFDGQDIEPKDFHFHVTVYYTDKEVYFKPMKIPVGPIQLKLDRIELLGKNHDVPVIKVDSSNLIEFRDLLTSQGFTDQWPEWKTHLSLSYNWNGTPDVEKLGYDGPPLFVDSFEVKNVEAAKT